MTGFGGGEGGLSPLRLQTKSYSPPKGRIALSANERIAEFLEFAIQAKFAYVNKLGGLSPLFSFSFGLGNRPETARLRRASKGRRISANRKTEVAGRSVLALGLHVRYNALQH